VAELTRGKTGRLYGNLMSILTTLKALRSSYNRDMQEDKEALFDSVDTVRSALELFSAMLQEIKINRPRMEAAANDPNSFRDRSGGVFGEEGNAVSRGARDCRKTCRARDAK
jgi:argininosuccinate lyase